MKRKRRTNILCVGMLTILAMASLTGCGGAERQVVTITNPSYERLTYQTVEVQRGDLSTSVTVKLVPEGYEEILYRAPRDEFELDEVYVAVGDRVEAGDILVSFGSERIRETIAQYEDEKSQKELLVQHYENLMKLDGEIDYEADIKMLREDIQVAQLYIDDAKKLLAEYQIVAKEDGIITETSEYLQNKVITQGVELITQVTGTGRYLATPSDTEMFAVGDVYQVSDGEIEYKLQLGDKDDGTLIFKPVSGTSLLSAEEKLTLTLEMPEQKNVVYVNRHAVCTINSDKDEEDTYCVYVMQEDGYQRAVFVTPGERIGENLIITDGLNGGEKVVIR